MSKAAKSNSRVPVLRKQHEQHAEMLRGANFGIEDSQGMLAILVCPPITRAGKYDLLTEEALRVADREAAVRGMARVILIESPSHEETLDVIADPTISSLAFIGDGTLGAFRLSPATHEKMPTWLSWYELLPAAGHLKTGTIEQRTCTHIDGTGRQIRMPLGTFIVADQTKIRLPEPGTRVSDFLGYDRLNDLMMQPFASPHNPLPVLVEQTGQSVEHFLGL